MAYSCFFHFLPHTFLYSQQDRYWFLEILSKEGKKKFFAILLSPKETKQLFVKFPSFLKETLDTWECLKDSIKTWEEKSLFMQIKEWVMMKKLKGKLIWTLKVFLWNETTSKWQTCLELSKVCGFFLLKVAKNLFFKYKD